MKTTAMAVFAFVVLGVPAWAAPKKIGNCGTINQPGAYIITDNITAAGDCLIIAADFVTIDFDNNVMTGNGTGSAIKGNGPLRKAITVRGGTIRNFINGIAFGFDGVNITVENMSVFNCSNVGIGINEFPVVRNNICSGNGDGINVGSRGLVTDNNSSMNTASGIVVSAGCTVVRNTAGHNGNNGIVTGAGCTVMNNTTQINGNYGIAVDCPTTVIANATTFNTTGDLLIQGTSCNQNHNVPLP